MDQYQHQLTIVARKVAILNLSLQVGISPGLLKAALEGLMTEMASLLALPPPDTLLRIQEPLGPSVTSALAESIFGEIPDTPGDLA